MDSNQKTGFDLWLQQSYLTDAEKSAITDTISVVGGVASIIAGVTSIVGIVGAIVSVVNFLQFSQPGPDLLSLVAQAVQRIETTLDSLFEWDTDANWNEVLGNLESTLTSLNHYLDGTAIPGSTRAGLLTDDDRIRLFDNVLTPLLTTRFTLLPTAAGGPSAFQRGAFSFGPDGRVIVDLLTDNFPEGAYAGRLDPAAVGVMGLPVVEPVEWRGSLTFRAEGGGVLLWWDYRRVLPHLLRTIAALITCYKLYDPAFRTTGRFKQDLQNLIVDLEIFAARRMSCISWANLRPLNPAFPDSDTSGWSAPSAYESRSRARFGLENETPETYWVSMPDEPVYSQKRLLYAQKIALYSGFLDFWNSIDQLRQLTNLPATTETVFPTTSMRGLRNFVRKDTVQRGGNTQNVKIYHVDWFIDVELTLQPQNPPYDYAAGHAITYEFFLESYSADPATATYPPSGPLQRIPLPLGNYRQVEMLVQNPELFVAGEDDGSYGPPPPPGNMPLPAPFKISLRRIAGQSLAPQFTPVSDPNIALANMSGLVKALDGKGQAGLGNKRLAHAAGAVHTVNQLNWASGPPANAQFGSGNPTACTFGVSLNYGPTGDVKDGVASFQCWNLDHQTVNVGTLYLVVEETPPGMLGTRIKTAIMLPLNPTETWYPGYVLAGPHYQPVS